MFVSEREGDIPMFAAYTSHPWDLLGYTTITLENLASVVLNLPTGLGELVEAVLGREVCSAVGVTNFQIEDVTSGVIHLRPNPGREDDIIPLLRELTGQTEARDPERADDFDMDDLMAELLTKQLFRPRPHA